MTLDQVTLVNEQDQPIGVMDKVEAHRGKGQLHRAISVYIFRKNNSTNEWELLIQQRSALKIVGAGQWANTCCGNVRPGENYEECAMRRLQEELGIQEIKLQPTKKFIYQVPCGDEFSEHELDQVFIGIYNGDVNPNPKEVSAYRWVAVNQFLQEVDKDLQTNAALYAPWVHVMRKQELIPILD